jgi:hypothetical protein
VGFTILFESALFLHQDIKPLNPFGTIWIAKPMRWLDIITIFLLSMKLLLPVFMTPIQNRVLFVPGRQGTDEFWYYYDCQTEKVVAYPHHQTFASSLNGSFLYSGGAYDPHREQIIFSPGSIISQPTWHLFDCQTTTIQAYAAPSISSLGFSGAVYDPMEKRVIFVPG